MNQYFTTGKGLTMTSAQHLCNLAQEYLMKSKSELDSLNFYNKTVTQLSTGNTMSLTNYKAPCMNYEERLNRIGTIYAFVSWLKEAIKEKQFALDHTISYTDWMKQTHPNHHRPNEKTPYVFEDALSELSIAELADYYLCQQMATYYGKFIHKDGPYNIARTCLAQKSNVPTTIEQYTNDILKYDYKPLVSLDQVDEYFNKLQNIYREWERRLNTYKFKLEERVREKNRKLTIQYQQELQEYKTLESMYHNEYQLYVDSQKQEIRNLKILVPNEFQTTFEVLNSLGK